MVKAVSMLVLVVVVVFGGVTAYGPIESNFYRSERCALAQGYCVLPSECPHEVKKEHQNICVDDGAVCCQGIPSSEVNCHQQHNTCMERCPSHLNKGQKGCEEGKTCCELVI